MAETNELSKKPCSGMSDLTVKLESELLTGMLRILSGINMTEIESDNGWWETSTGTEFGSDKLLELIKFMSETVRSNVRLGIGG